MIMKILRRFTISLLFLLAIATLSLVIWATVSVRPATERALQTLVDSGVTREAGLLVFQPDAQPTSGLIYYPGGLVDPEAYANTAQGLADAGYLVIVPKMPLNLAVTGINRAEQIMASFPEVESWVIGGHSLGGAMAAEYAKGNPEQVNGLIFFASRPGTPQAFINTPFPILIMYGTQESGAPRTQAFYEVVADSAELYIIQGGNHAQFGDYGLQDGDGTATITVDDQQQQIIEQTIQFMQSLE